MFILYRKALVLLALGAASALPSVVVAHGRYADHEQATQALAAGEILPLRTVLQSIERNYPGRVMGVEFERSNDIWIYKMKILQRGGLLLKLKVDAKTAQVLDIKKRSVRHRGKKDAHSGSRR